MLSCCICYEEEATTVLIEYFQSINTGQALRKVDIVDISGTFHNNLPDFAHSILRVPTPAPTIGSSLRHLCLGGAAANSLWDYLESDHASSRLEHISVTYLDNDDEVPPPNGQTMIRSIPKLAHLRTLKIDSFPWCASTHEGFMNAFRSNGSLHKVCLTDIPGSCTPSAFTASDLKKLTAYAQRNEHTPHLLAEAGTEEDRSHLQSFPPLFTSASAAPRTAPGNVLIGLLTLDDCTTS